MSKKFIFSLLISLLLSTPAYCGYNVQPNRFEGNMPAGETFENKFIVTNSFDEPIKIVAVWTDRTINPLNEDWLTLPQTYTTVPPNGRAYVPFKVTLPENAEGEYNAFVKFTMEPADPSKAVARLAIHYTKPIYISAAGTEKFDFIIKGPALKNTEKPEIKTILLNTGNTHIRPTGTIEIINLNDESDKYSVDFNQTEWAIIPEQQYLYTDSLKIDEPLKDGTYKLTVVIQAGIENNMIKKSSEFTFNITDGKLKVLESSQNKEEKENDNE